MTATRPAIVRIDGVSKSFVRGSEEVHALRSVTAELRRGELVALVGPSGSGKSTLLNVLAGWERPDQGSVAWVQDERARPEDLGWKQVAVVPQTLGLLEELTLRDNVLWPVRLGASTLSGEEGKRRVETLLRVLGLEEMAARYPWEVSLGEQQRAAIARALVLVPALLLADEPTGHQDEDWTLAVLKVLRAAVRAGTSCLLATHNAEVIAAADRVLAIRDGGVHEAERSAPFDEPLRTRS